MNRLALLLLQLGAITVVLVVTPRGTFDLDRFLVPKEVVLHTTAVLAGIFALRRMVFSRVDWMLVGFLALTALSAAFATNPWLGIRGATISASAVVLFWVGRALRDAGFARPLLNTLAFAVVLAAVTALLQAYGLEIDLFPRSRAPGGTLGNRNFVGHAAAFGMPLVLLAALRGRRFLFGATGVLIVMGTLVLTRSRAAWLAFALSMTVFLVAAIVSRSVPWRRFAFVLLFAGAGVALALLLPNALRWRSENPYLESVQGVVNYEEGSGRGRLIQYTRSLRMAAAFPILGVGPGNWPVMYPEYAARRDGSMNGSEPGTTFNPWPSSDWIAFVSERGFAAALLLAAAFATVFFRGARRPPVVAVPEPEPDVAPVPPVTEPGEERLGRPVLLATITAALIAGAFDAVLLLPLPSFVVWTAMGVLWVPASARPRRIVAFLVLLVSVVGAARSVAQLTAMEIYATHGDRSSLERAARIDPGNYRVRMKLARKGRCEHAIAAQELLPSAEAAKAAARRCR